MVGRDPQLVPEVARVAGPADVDLDPRDRRGTSPEVAQVGPIPAGRGVEDDAAEGTLQGEGCDRLADLLDLHVESGPVHAKPAQVRVGGGPAIRRRVESRDGPVVDDVAVLVAPACIDDLPVRDLRGVPGEDAVDQAGRVGTPDEVLEQRRHVDDGGRLADGVVLDVPRVGIGAGGEVAGPLAPLELAHEGRGARVKGRAVGERAERRGAPATREKPGHGVSDRGGGHRRGG